jgi:hypothetical protein
MNNENLNFEEVNAHFEKADLVPFQKGGEKHFTAATAADNPAGTLQRICSIYKVVRPFLVLISNLPLIPAKWKEAIKTFIGLMDTLCP